MHTPKMRFRLGVKYGMHHSPIANLESRKLMHTGHFLRPNRPQFQKMERTPKLVSKEPLRGIQGNPSNAVGEQQSRYAGPRLFEAFVGKCKCSWFPVGFE